MERATLAGVFLSGTLLSVHVHSGDQTNVLRAEEMSLSGAATSCEGIPRAPPTFGELVDNALSFLNSCAIRATVEKIISPRLYSKFTLVHLSSFICHHLSSFLTKLLSERRVS